MFHLYDQSGEVVLETRDEEKVMRLLRESPTAAFVTETKTTTRFVAFKGTPPEEIRHLPEPEEPF